MCLCFSCLAIRTCSSFYPLRRLPSGGRSSQTDGVPAGGCRACVGNRRRNGDLDSRRPCRNEANRTLAERVHATGSSQGKILRRLGTERSSLSPPTRVRRHPSRARPLATFFERWLAGRSQAGIFVHDLCLLVGWYRRNHRSIPLFQRLQPRDRDVLQARGRLAGQGDTNRPRGPLSPGCRLI